MILQHLTSVSGGIYGRCLAGQIELLCCYYNFVRPHGGLKFGTKVRTPAMQAGLVGRKLTFRDIFTAAAGFLLLVALVIHSRNRHEGPIARSVLA
jgi:hypothetical protein